MEFDFDRVIDRFDTNSIATDGYRRFLLDDETMTLPVPDDEVISLWVADMAFPSAPAAIDAMTERIAHPIFGYSFVADNDLFDAFAGWCRRRYDWSPERDHFVTSPGVVPALFDLVELVLGPDDKVLTLTPAFGFFEHAATFHGRALVPCGLVKDPDGRYEIDFDAFEVALADPAVKMFFLCHPHNPTGRVWTDTELRRMAELCFEQDVLVVSDEIHCDLLRTGLTHTPLATLFPDSDRIVTCMSSSKTFNLAGLGIANVLIPDDDLRQAWLDHNMPIVNPISVAAATGVFRNGDEWWEALRRYVDANFDHLAEVLADRVPQARFRVPEATYLAWIDLSAYFDADTDLTRFFAEQAGVLIEGGEKFVADGDGHIRINLACPRSMLDEAMDRIISAMPRS